MLSSSGKAVASRVYKGKPRKSVHQEEEENVSAQNESPLATVQSITALSKPTLQLETQQNNSVELAVKQNAGEHSAAEAATHANSISQSSQL